MGRLWNGGRAQHGHETGVQEAEAPGKWSKAGERAWKKVLGGQAGSGAARNLRHTDLPSLTPGSDLASDKALPQAFAECLLWLDFADSLGGKTAPLSCKQSGVYPGAGVAQGDQPESRKSQEQVWLTSRRTHTWLIPVAFIQTSECFQSTLSVPRSVKICINKTPIDAQALKKKASKVTCSPAVHAILSSLLLYLAHHEDGSRWLPSTGKARRGDSQLSWKPEPQDASQRPTRFQLLQAKFMGTGREPCLKKTREVGRLIFKDKQGPSRSLVSATINKLLEKTREGAGSSARGQGPLGGGKPRWGLPAGKNTVKNILKKFLAAEEKEAEEKRLREKPPAERPKAAGGLLPKIMGKKSSVLSKLREKFEQSSCLCSEASVLLLHTEERKKKNLQRKKAHKPEARVLRTAAVASTCIGMPPARFLACSAEPVPAFSVATVVCGPRSWLAHCTKVKHLDLGPMPPKESGRLSCENKTPGKELLTGGPSQSLTPQAAAPSLQTGSLGAGPECLPEPAPSPASQRGEALPGLEPSFSSLRPASPGHAGAADSDRVAGLQAGGPADDTQGAKGARTGLCPGPAAEGTEEAPRVDLMVCVSEDDEEGVSPDSEPDPLFAIQKAVPEPKAPGHIPPLSVPPAQAARRTQQAFEPPQITVRLPVVHDMPLPPATRRETSERDDQRSRVLGGENAAEHTRARCPATTERGSTAGAAEGVSEPAGAPGRPGSPAGRHSTADPSLTPPLGGAASVGRDIPGAAPTLEPRSPAGGKGGQHGSGNSNTLKHREDTSGKDVSKLSYEKHQLPESEEMLVRAEDTPSHCSAASGNRHSAPGNQPVPSPNQGNSTGVPTVQVAPTGSWTRPEHVTTVHKDIPCEQEERRGPSLTESVQTQKMAEGSTSHDLGTSRPVSLNEDPTPSFEAPGRGMATGVTKSHTALAPGNAIKPEKCTPEKQNALSKGEFSCFPTSHSLVAEDLCHESQPHLFLSPGGPLRHPSSRAAEGGICKDLGQHRPATLELLTALPQEEAGLLLMPDEPGLGVSTEPAASKVNAAVGSGNTAQAGRWRNNTRPSVATSNHPTPQGSGVEGPPRPSLDKPPSSSEKQKAKDEKHVMSERQLPLGSGVSHQFPSVPSIEAEGQQVNRAPQKCPDLQGHLLPAPHTQKGVASPNPEKIKPKEKPQPGAGLASREEEVPGPAGMKGPVQKGVPPSSQRTAVYGSGEAPTQPQDGVLGSDVGTTDEISFQHAEKGPEHPPGQRVWTVEDPSEPHSVHTEDKQAPVCPERQACPTQAQPGGMAPHNLTQPTNNSTAVAPTTRASRESQRPTPRGGQGAPGVSQKMEEHHLQVAKSQTSSCPEPAQSSAVPKPNAPAQEGSLDISGIGRDTLDLEHQRKSTHFAKYKAQSFGDQRSFDLSFRTKIIRTNDTFELPK
ncbi:nascent polypeptide-associated complex subunit alpha, muscle-specific form-like [Saccopteryx bilineata]|uniref:nascent polypeptide-associated complex subunit alpha, muscle-specific form-like n=1 Tax=Saccopteryx bilineata TaxID=59482 RepID=UPI00338E986D